MASQANLEEIPKTKKKQKIFGGPSLERLWRLNFYFRDYRLTDTATLQREGSNEVIDSVFAPTLFAATWLQQLGSYFGEVEQFAWDEAEKKLYFVDSVSSKIFSYHASKALDIEHEFNNTVTTEGNTLVRKGPSGIALDETEPTSVYISESALKRVTRLNLKTKKTTIIADLKHLESSNVPYHLTLSPSKKYLYLTDPLASSIYRVNVNAAPHSLELVTTQVKHPTHITFSSQQPNRVFVGNCIQGDYSVFVFEVDKNEQWTLLNEWDRTTLQWNNSTIKGHFGCVRGLASIPGYLLVTCPGGRVCIVDEKERERERECVLRSAFLIEMLVLFPNMRLILILFMCTYTCICVCVLFIYTSRTGVMRAAVKLYDGIILNDILIADNQIWMAANFSFWRSYLSNEKKKVEL
ncbi:hypothetical protein RFI_23239 [Reticulomyxa filosa]|uniref:SMP-30/Gluconolactonase/LRE-like region domain-containing protein n=1 Tax=Reticulomyxa filosa TaxID=46433 RepID=X6MJD8_RETFI|nr:hypothetical protein RFI_23239 [Reticulomyxa filosa]|eukprot:ETO14128.1 hypothetical protein RFI_23239 [Reticulomyxa filosa]